MTTVSKELLIQWLEALSLPVTRWNKRQTEIVNAAIASLQAAIDQSDPEPVAVVGDVYALYWYGSEPLVDLLKRHPSVKAGSFLYDHPAPAKPLTVDQIDECMKKAREKLGDGRDLEYIFAREIEAVIGAHQ